MTTEYITYEQVKPLMPKLDEISEDVREYVVSRIQQNFKRYVSQFNHQYEELHNEWPEASPILLFMGFISGDCSQEELLHKLSDPGYRMHVREELEKRMHTSINDSSKRHDEVEDRKLEKTVDDILNSMPEERVKKFISLYHEYWRNISHEEFGRKVGLQVDVCKRLIKKMKREGYFSKAVAKPLTKKRRKRDEDVFIKELTGITFIKDGENYRLGLQTALQDDNPLNPLPGVPDPLTQKPMRHPMMCPDFYILDKDTWTKRISETHKHPYLNTPLGNKRDLIEITIDNFQKYRNQFRNLDCSEYGL